MADTIYKDVKCKFEPNKKKFSKKVSKSTSDYIVRRRCPPHATKRKNDVYVTSSADFRGQLTHCMKLVDDGETEIIIHGLGGAIPQAINLALQLHERLTDSFEIATNTDTVDVVDDLEPVVDEQEGDTRVTSNSSVYIKLFKRTTEVE